MRSFFRVFSAILALLLLVVLMSAGASCAFSLPQHKRQPRHENDSGLSCERISRMSPKQFVDYYVSRIEKRGGHPISATYWTAYGLYSECRSEANSRLLKRLPPGERQKMTALRTTLRAWETTAIDLCYCCYGGGTGYIVTASECVATHEAFIGKLLRHPASARRQGRRQARRVLKVARQLTSALARGNFALGDLRARYRNDVREFRAETVRLEAMLRRCRDALANRIGGRMEAVYREMDLSFEVPALRGYKRQVY